jgi:peptidoglycan pentaglycine glycine transferase (the first glycine)
MESPETPLFSTLNSPPPNGLRCELLSKIHQQEWDALNQASPTGCFMQSWAWAEFKEREGFLSFRYGLFQGDRLVGGCFIYGYPRAHPANLLMVPGGPSLPIGQEADGMSLLLEQAKILAQDFGAIALRIEPSYSKSPSWLEGFVRAPVDVLPSETLWIDLSVSEVELLAGMWPKGRYNIRLSQRHGVTTVFSTDSQFIPTFYDVFWETVERQGFFGEPYGFFINLCQTLFQANIAEIGVATLHGEVLAVMLLVYWGKQATYLYGGRATQHPQVMASYALHWAAMQRAKERGCERYDFYGYTRDSKHAYAKFSRFKRQFGGEVVTTIGAHDYFFYDHLANTLIEILNRLPLENP